MLLNINTDDLILAAAEEIRARQLEQRADNYAKKNITHDKALAVAYLEDARIGIN